MRNSKFAKISPIILFLGVAASNVGLARNPTEIPLPTERIFTPHGFDDNDNVEVILHGHFPSSCFKIGRITAQVNEQDNSIDIKATAFEYTASNCIEAQIPFIESIRVGALDKGKYSVRLIDRPGINATLIVNQHLSESPDEHLYAATDGVSIAKDRASGKFYITITGRHPKLENGCIKISEIKLNSMPNNMLEVQPITKAITGEECQALPADRRFEVKTAVDEPFVGEGLVHIRVLNGSSINQLVYMQ